MKKKKIIVNEAAKDIVVDNIKKQVKLVGDGIGEALFGRSWQIKDIFANFYNSCKKAYFLNFLCGIGFDISTNSIDEKKINSLSQKLVNNKNYEYVTEILDSVFFTHSQKCCTILGLITSKLLMSNEFTYVDRIISLALKDMFDNDLELFSYFYSMESVATNNMADKRLSIVSDYSDEQRIVLEKLTRLNLLGNDLAGGRFTAGNEEKHPLRYEKTLVSDSLDKYIKMIENVPYEIQV